MTIEAAPREGPMRLFFHPASSASTRVTLYLRCRGIPASLVELVGTDFETDHRGIPDFTIKRSSDQAMPGPLPG